jgi:hypothetical protein
MQVGFDDIAAILDVCLERMQCGESIEACLLDYPSEADELEPLLIAAAYARSTFRPPLLAPDARRAIQRQLRQAVVARQPSLRRTRASSFRPLIMRFALALVVALFSLGGGVAAAQSSLPGNSLYPLKRASEAVRIRLASSATQRASLHLDFAAARSAEIIALASSEQRTIDETLVDDLDQEYQLAWEEIEQTPANEVPDLVGRYVVERRADIRMFSASLAHVHAVTSVQIQRAVRLGEQALAVVAPGEGPVPRPIPERDVNTGGTSTYGAPEPTNMPATVVPKATPEDRPADAGRKATPEGKPADAGPKATPEGKPADAGPKATPEGKPADAGSNPKPQPKPNHGKP